MCETDTRKTRNRAGTGRNLTGTVTDSPPHGPLGPRGEPKSERCKVWVERRKLWLDRFHDIRIARANGDSYETIGDRYGVTRGAIYLFCKQHGIKSPRYGRKQEKQRPPHVPRIDPAKAKAITDAKRRYWQGAA